MQKILSRSYNESPGLKLQVQTDINRPGKGSKRGRRRSVGAAASNVLPKARPTYHRNHFDIMKRYKVGRQSRTHFELQPDNN